MLAKLTPLQSFAVLVVCLASIIIAHRFSPGAVALVASLSGTVVASLLRPPGVPEPPSPGAPPPPPSDPVTVPEGRRGAT